MMRCRRRAGFVLAVAVLAIAALTVAVPALRSQPPPPHDHSATAPPAGHAHAGNDSATERHGFSGATRWAAHFEDPARDAWQLPDSVVTTLVVRDDLVVADIGSATGYFPVRFARRLPHGFVIGADIEPDMVRYLNDRARSEGLQNLVSVLAGPDDPHLPRQVDLVFLCDTYHHIDARVAYFERLAAQLRPGGRIAIVDFRPGSSHGPPHKLAREAVVAEMQSAGYRLVQEFTYLPEQYFLVFGMQE